MLRVKKLKINPPRRRESERMKTRRSASAASTPTTATSGTSVGDTIEVAQKSSDGPAEAVSDATVATMPDAPPESTKTTPAKGEAAPAEVGIPSEKTTEQPMQPSLEEVDHEMVDAVSLVALSCFLIIRRADRRQDDAVIEYDFTHEKEINANDDEKTTRPIFKDTDNDVITISSDDELPQETFPVDSRPWRSMEPIQREAKEQQYCLQRNRPIHGDWEKTELYQEMLDLEMEEFVSPLHNG